MCLVLCSFARSIISCKTSGVLPPFARVTKAVLYVIRDGVLLLLVLYSFSIFTHDVFLLVVDCSFASALSASMFRC